MIKNKIYSNLITFILVVLVAASFWAFGRFTVDDAFISWRYGKNLVNHGIWNYNPNYLDMTQAYTNPIYAFLSIIPNYFGIDIVLFFKLFSILNVLVFVVYISKKIKGSKIMILAFFAMPATIIHLFSGLETFLFISLLFALFVSFYENKFRQSIVLTILLFLTRPESWLLVLLTPMFYLISHIKHNTFSDFFKNITKLRQFKWKAFIISFMLLSSILLIYFAIHQHIFGSIFPNTFYIKRGLEVNFKLLLIMLAITSPLLILILMKKYNLFITFGVFLIIVAFKYSMSNLTMNYASRFGFHIFAPVFFILLYLSSKLREDLSSLSVLKVFKKNNNLKVILTSNVISILFLIFFFCISIYKSDITNYIEYYPRVLDSHAIIGKKLKQISEEHERDITFSFSDAGITAYYSNLNTLDNIGLGSSLVAKKNGVDNEILELYNPEIVLFQSSQNGIKKSFYNQENIFKWVTDKKYNYIGQVYSHQYYIIKIYSRNALDYKLFEQIFKLSKKKNDISSKEYIIKNLANSPFSYWHE